MALPDILHRGVTRSLRGKPGEAPYILEFSDHYSVCDWGDMPEELQGKAVGMAFLAWFFFDYLGRPGSWQDKAAFPGFEDSALLQQLGREGLAHYMIGLAGGDLRPLSLQRQILSPSKLLLVKPLAYPDVETKNAIDLAGRYLPVKVQVRFSDETASSAAVTFVTEDALRRLSAADMADYTGLSPQQVKTLGELAVLTAQCLKSACAAVEVQMMGADLNFAVLDAGETGTAGFMLAGSLGADDLILYSGDTRLSQEVLQQGYKGSNWLAAVEQARALARERGDRDWKRFCTEELKAHPPLLSPLVKEKAVMVYTALARALSHRHLGQAAFPKAWDIARVAQSLSPRGK